MAVLAHEHEPETENSFTIALSGDRAAADFVALSNIGNVANKDRCAILSTKHDVSDLIRRGRQRDAVDKGRFAGTRDESAADRLVVLSECFSDIVHRHAVFDQAGRINDHFVLLAPSTPCVDLSDTRHLTELRLDHPLVEGRQLGETCGIFTLPGDDVMEDFAQPGREGPHLWPLDPVREFHSVEPFTDHLSGKIDVRTVFESNRELRKSEPRNRADIDQPRKTRDDILNRNRDLLFNLLRRERRSDRVDLHLHRCRVGESIDWQMTHRVPTPNDETQRAEQYGKAVSKRPPDDPVQHTDAPSWANLFSAVRPACVSA